MPPTETGATSSGLPPDPGSAPMGDGTVERGDPGPGGHGIAGALHVLAGLAADTKPTIEVNTHAGPAITGEHFVPEGSVRDYDAAALMGEFKIAGPEGLTLAKVQADADALWRRQYNDGPLGSSDPTAIDPV